MTRDEIIKLAREADLWLTSPERIAAVERFATLVAEAEREACAQIVESEAMAYSEPAWAVEIVNDIRARGDK